jgi:hypothetical protein
VKDILDVGFCHVVRDLDVVKEIHAPAVKVHLDVEKLDVLPVVHDAHNARMRVLAEVIKDVDLHGHDAQITVTNPSVDQNPGFDDVLDDYLFLLTMKELN